MILHLYLAKRFFIFIGIVLVVFLVLTGIADLAERVGKLGSTDVPFSNIIALTLFSVPVSVYKIFPLVVIIASLMLFLSLARSSELIVIRAGGRSILNSLLGPLVAAFIVGVITVAVWNPLNASLQHKHDTLLEQLAGKTPNSIALTGTGLWLRQSEDNGYSVINAKRSNADGTRLLFATFWRFDDHGDLNERIFARTATLNMGHWALGNAKIWRSGFAINPESDSETHTQYDLPSTLTQQQIQESFGDPAGQAIWELPQFIARLEATGFTATRHRVWLFSELTLPIFLVALVLISAVFSTHLGRVQGTAPIVISTFIFGFLLFFLRNFAKILSENEQLAPIFAATAPPIIGLALALALLLHREDG